MSTAVKPLTSINSLRYNVSSSPWTCLHCGTPCPPKGWRGCCSPQCAAAEHDQEPPDRED